MKITESQLRKIIRSIIKEVSLSTNVPGYNSKYFLVSKDDMDDDIYTQNSTTGNDNYMEIDPEKVKTGKKYLPGFKLLKQAVQEELQQYYLEYYQQINEFSEKVGQTVVVITGTNKGEAKKIFQRLSNEIEKDYNNPKQIRIEY